MLTIMKPNLINIFSDFTLFNLFKRKEWIFFLNRSRHISGPSDMLYKQYTALRNSVSCKTRSVFHFITF